MPDLRAYARTTATRAGVDPDLFVRQIQQESRFRPDAHNPSGASGIAQIIERWHPAMAGRTRDPIASLDYAADLMAGYFRQFGSWRRAMAAYNWGSGNVGGYTKQDGTVVPPWDGRRETLPAETRHYLDVILGDGWPEPGSVSASSNEEPKQEVQILSADLRNTLRTTEAVRLRRGPGIDTVALMTLPAGAEVEPLTDHAWRNVKVGNVSGWVAAEYLTDSVQPEIPANGLPVVPARTFDPTTPAELQRQDWTCSIRSVMWLLKSLGIDVTPDEAQDAMSPRYVTPAVGLLDGSGAGIVKVLRERWGVEAVNYPSVTFDQVAALAGKQPVAIGGHNWGGAGLGHWSAVRGFENGRLVLANPAQGAAFGQQTLTREQWAWRGPWSAVTVPL